MTTRTERWRPLDPDMVPGSPPGALPAYVANGLLGLRVREIPLRAGVVTMSGLAGEDPEARVEGAPYVPYPLAGDLRIGDLWLSDALQAVDQVEQRYDFSTAELTSRFCFAGDGATAIVEVVTFASRSEPTLVLQEISVEVNAACDVRVHAVVDPGSTPGTWRDRETSTPGDPEPAVDGAMWWAPPGGLDTCGIAYVTRCDAPDAVRVISEQRDSPLMTEYSFRARAGRRYRVHQIASMVPSVLHHQPHREAVRLASRGGDLGFEELRSENRAAWQDLWKGRVHLVGADPMWQRLADASLFYLLSSVHPSSPASTSIFGLARWRDYHYYYGHVMWDIEFFTVPVLSLLYPSAARTLLEYRSSVLPAARANAKLNGYRGLQFPWESGPTNGEESSPGKGKASHHEDHVSGDVAWAFGQFADLTGDTGFAREHAWPVLQGVADWIASRVTRTDRGYELRRSMGIAEREQAADNQAFTNMGAVVVLRQATTIGARLGKDVDPLWAEIARGLVIPRDSRTRSLRSHDGHRLTETKGATPDPLAGLFPLGYETDGPTEEATLRTYLDVADDYLGSPMLSALYGVWAARLGDRARSLALFEQGFARFTTGRFLQTLEYDPAVFPDEGRAGPFFANLSGFLQGLLFGLPGLHINGDDPERWPRRPVVLPTGWDAIEVDRVWVRGRPARLTASHGADRARLTFEDPGALPAPD
jgi:protein-glucosylgalactosylhydroxylysine glucosidase